MSEQIGSELHVCKRCGNKWPCYLPQPCGLPREIEICQQCRDAGRVVDAEP
jgi:hypothetical protein